MGRRLIALFGEAENDSVNDSLWPVLTRFELGLDPADDEFDANNRPQLSGDEVLRHIVHAHRSRACRCRVCHPGRGRRVDVACGGV